MMTMMIITAITAVKSCMETTATIEIWTINQQNKLALWAGRILECRSSGQNVKIWCKETDSVSRPTIGGRSGYSRWQRPSRKSSLPKLLWCSQFAPATPLERKQIFTMAQITSTVNEVLRILKLC